MAFEIEKLVLDGVVLINLFSSGDARGGFVKYFEHDIFRSLGIDFYFSEILASTSRKGVIRGLHFQRPNAQAKIVSVMSGAIYDVVVDLRVDSPTFLRHITVELSAAKPKALLVPRGFAHGFLSIADNTIVSYLCDGAYDRDSETGIRFDDPSLGIAWPINIGEAIVSERDASFSYFDEALHAF